MSQLIPENYSDLLQDIKERVRTAQYKALKAANKELVLLYWDIGRAIVDRQSNEAWGKAVVENLAKDLQKEFPGIQGFSARNIWRMRDFFVTYQNNEKLSPLVTEIGWTHNLIILVKCKDDLEREFYIRMTRKYGWTKNILSAHLDNKSYEKTLLNQTNFDKNIPEEARKQAKLAVKDEYTFGFLELGEEYSERELERSLMERMDAFLREMGGSFAFLGSQYRLEVGDEEYFIDILLYHRDLKALTAIELKTGKFLPEYIGKMQFYLAVLDDKVRRPDENPSIGIILCKDKNKTIVEYSLRESNKPIGVGKYRTVTELPEEYRGSLPEPEQVAKLLEGIEEKKSA